MKAPVPADECREQPTHAGALGTHWPAAKCNWRVVTYRAFRTRVLRAQKGLAVEGIVRLRLIAVALFLIANLARTACGISVAAGVQVGAIASVELNEVSGLAASRSLADTLWVHNDSGDTARFFAVSKAGNLQGTFSLNGATAHDWEDIAIGPKPGGGNYLYLADIGDNSLQYSHVSIYRVDEPQISTGGTIAAASYKQLKLQYPGGAINAESFLVDPISGDLLIIKKDASSPTIYRAPGSAFNDVSQTTTMAAQGVVNAPLFLATAADISPDGMHIVVRDYTTAYLFERTAGQSVADALHGTPLTILLKAETQGEAIGWAADGKGFYTTSEGASTSTPQPIYYYAVTVPEPAGVVLGIGGFLAWGVFLPGKKPPLRAQFRRYD